MTSLPESCRLSGRLLSDTLLQNPWIPIQPLRRECKDMNQRDLAFIEGYDETVTRLFLPFSERASRCVGAVPGSDLQTQKRHPHCVVDGTQQQFGESITSACERIATDLAAAKRLNPKTTRWIQHEPPQDDLPQLFDELQFTWDSNHTAYDAQWHRLGDEQAEALTGDSLSALNRRLGDFEFQIEEGTEHEPEAFERSCGRTAD